MAKDKLRYVKGYCELEDGIVRFVGGMNGVSDLQCWYYIIYAIRDRFPKIDYWIDPSMEECRTLPSTANHLRYGVCKSLQCTFEAFPNGEIRRKRKLTQLDKNKYEMNRAKVSSEFIPVLEFEPTKEPISFEDNGKTHKMSLGFDITKDGKDMDDYVKTNTSSYLEVIRGDIKDYNKALVELVELSYKLFNNEIKVEVYENKTSAIIEDLDRLLNKMQSSKSYLIKSNMPTLREKTKTCASKIAWCSNNTKNEELDNAFAGVSIAILRISNSLTVRKAGAQDVR
ncbi:hypothetical protein UT300012_21290 [Paraclostridium bifermentans]